MPENSNKLFYLILQMQGKQDMQFLFASYSVLILVWDPWVHWHMSPRGGNSQQFLAVQILKRCPDFYFISNRKSEQVVQKYVFTFSFFFKTQIWPSRFLERCSHFRFWWKSKCEHLSCPNLYRKGVQISIFIKNENVNTFPKIWTARFAFWKKMTMWTRISVRPVKICDLK